MGNPRLHSAAIFVVVSALLGGAFAQAEVLSEEFTSSARYGSGELVWNTVRGQLHPPLEVYQYIDGGSKDKQFLVGSGAHGAFTPSRYAEFSDGGDVSGNVIRLDTSVYSVLEVTSFELAAGWTLEPIGSGPLIIRALGSVTIAGVIDCSGSAGENQNGDPTTVTMGGRGRCGGGNGGNGGTTTVAAGAGTAGGPLIPNGVGPGVDGPTAGAGASLEAAGGGGGGTYAISRGAGYDPAAGEGVGAGAAGFIVADNDFDYLGGGFGGGGGAHFSSGAVGQNSAGGGGGGGGGLIFITAAGDISITGSVLARGGDGGGGGYLSGGGGGGAGGSIALFAGGDVYLAGAAVVNADGGNGAGLVGRRGGDGSVGRTWLVGSSGYSVLVPPLVTPEFPDPSVTDVGVVRYQSGTFTLTSAAIDIGNTRPRLDSVNVLASLAAGSSVRLEVASAADSGSVSNYLATTSLPLELDRWMKFRLVMVNTDRVSPTWIESLTLDIALQETGKFDFKAACGAVTRPPTGTDVAWWILPVLLFLTLRFLPRPTGA